MGSTIGAGILGFVGGYAGQRADQMNLDEDREYKEALRLRKEESAILKERRIMTLKQELGLKFRDEELASDQLLLPDGSLDTSGLDEDLAATANKGNIRDWQKTQAGRNTKDTELRSVSPDTLLGTNDQLKGMVSEGPIRTDGRSASPSELRTQFNEVRRLAERQLEAFAPRFGDTQRKLLQNTAGLSDVASDPEAQAAWSSLTQNMAYNAVLAEANDKMRNSPGAFDMLSPEIIIEKTQARQQDISKRIIGGAGALKEAMELAKDRGVFSNRRDQESVAKQLIDRGFVHTNGQRIHVRNDLRELGYWNDSVSNLIFETMLEVR